MRQKTYDDETIKEDIKSFFQDPDHEIYQYGDPTPNCNPDSPYHRKQIEILFEDRYFHWVTHRIVDQLVNEGFLKKIPYKLSTGVEMIFVIRHNVRYYKDAIKKRVRLVEKYSSP